MGRDAPLRGFAALGAEQLQPQRREHAMHLEAIEVRNADKSTGARLMEHDITRELRRLSGDVHLRLGFTTRNLQDEPCRDSAGGENTLRINATFEAIARI